MDIYPINIPKSLLDAAPGDERIFYLSAGQIINDLNIMTKITYFAMNPIQGHKVIERVNVAISMLMPKIIAEKVNETWNYVTQQFALFIINTKVNLATLGEDASMN